MAEAISTYLNVQLAEAAVRRFSDMEVFVEILENVRGEDVYVVQSTSYPANDNLMELLVAIDALRRGSASRITAVIIEVSAIVASFISQLQDLYDTYGGTSWYKIVVYTPEKKITSLSKEKVRNILEKMIKENHGEAMLKKKTNQLLAKLEIL